MIRKYAENTQVPVARTRDEIDKLLKKHGATGFMYGENSTQAMVLFEMRNRRLKFMVPMPSLNKTRSNEKDVARETRRRWRALLLVLKAKLEAVISEIVEFDHEFLAHIVINGSETVGDRLVPEIGTMLETKTLPPLLLAAGS